VGATYTNYTYRLLSKAIISIKGLLRKPHVLSLVVREKLKDYNDRYITLINQVDGEKRSGRLLLNVRKDSLNHQLETGTSFTLKELFIKINPN
jgi:competence protein ComEC